MKTSESIKDIAAALAKAQGATATKNRINPHFKNAYADLTAIWDAIRDPLKANGIAVIQGCESDGAKVTITTRLAHTSGEWIESELAVNVAQATAQGIGSAITYGRRYGLSAMLGVASDDEDDGEAASKPTPAPVKPHPPAEPAKAPPPHVAALWKRCKDTFADKASDRWEAAASVVFGDAPVKSSEWSVIQTQDVERALFPPKDLPF